MGFWDDFKVFGSDVLQKGGKIAKEVSLKAQDAADMTKIKLDIAARKKEIRDLYMKIGKAYYEAYKEDAVEFADDVNLINQKFAAIDELNAKYEIYHDAEQTAKKSADGSKNMQDEEDAIEVIFAETDELEE